MATERQRTRAKPLIACLEKLSGAKLSESEKEQISEIAAASETFLKQLHQWVGHTSRLAEELTTGSPDENVAALFWIRLWGVFDEIIPRLQELANHFPGADKGFQDRFCGLKALLSDEELIFVEYLRHSQVHLAPSMLNVKPARKKKGTGGFLKVDTTYGKRSIYELQQGITAIWTRVEKSGIPPEKVEPYLAQEIARKICQPLEAIYNDMRDWIHAR